MWQMQLHPELQQNYKFEYYNQTFIDTTSIIIPLLPYPALATLVSANIVFQVSQARSYRCFPSNPLEDRP